MAAVSGAVALSALAVPTAHADEAYGDTKISNVVVNGGKAVVFGPTAKKAVKVTFTATDNRGINFAMALPYRGSNIEKATGALLPDRADGYAKCTKVNSTTSNCVATFTVKPDEELLSSWAGNWKVWGVASAKDGDYVEKDNIRTFKLLRQAQLTVNATPEPVKKGKTLTVTGKLTRANWDTGKYAGHTQQSVKLQFKKKGTSAYKTVKTVKSGTGGALKTTVKASVDGTYRYSFAGTSTSPAINSAGDAIDVK
ncbi:calcium-binding protein [Streptomyces sp. CRN 30]|uniref:calcium-binding protein n=1 Tax=Streptomyces sp. CRN 30 TaxID=3075613 RepID=UPI002A80B450|nr:calcium-binding protein [Streptomyces sp. CRN 30]